MKYINQNLRRGFFGHPIKNHPILHPISDARQRALQKRLPSHERRSHATVFRAPSHTRRSNVRGGLVLVGVTWKGAVLTTYVPEDSRSSSRYQPIKEVQCGIL